MKKNSVTHTHTHTHIHTVTNNICRARGSGRPSGSLNEELSGPITRQEREFQSGPVILSDPGQDYIKN